MNKLEDKNENVKESEENKQPPMRAYSSEPKSSVVEEPAMAYGEQRFSYADYLTWTDDVMREIINGLVYVFSAPMRRHAEAIAPFLAKTWAFITRRKGKCKIYTAPFDVRLSKSGQTADDQIFNVVQPDICVVCDPSKLDERGCIGAPDLIVEVSSSSTKKRDLKEKYFLYESVGVKEYWLVFPENKSVTVFVLNSEGLYDEGTTYEVARGQTKAPVRTLEGLVIDLEELFDY